MADAYTKQIRTLAELIEFVDQAKRKSQKPASDVLVEKFGFESPPTFEYRYEGNGIFRMIIQ